jgi:hypothetical protein
MAYTTINKSTNYFDTSTWTATTNSISNLNFSPDWVWIKSTDSGNGHILFDTIRGANKRLSSASTAAEATVTDELMSFDSNGYTLGSSGNTNDTSPSNASYVGWSWRGSDSSAASNSDGSITSTVSANTTAGFSIVKYTGTGANATVGHGLGVAPNMVLVKSLSGGGDWTSYHSVLGNTKYMRLNSTNAVGTQSTYWNDTSPTSTVFSLGSAGDTNTNSGTHIAYCFAEKTGYSKFGSYTGNGNADGAFVYTGFKPAWIMVKRTNSTDVWHIIDNKRDPFNSTSDSKYLDPASNAAQYDNSSHDFYSNGFKIRASGTNSNASGAPYIYMAFGQSLVGSNNVPCTAR